MPETKPLVAIIDDELDACDLLRILLESRGFRTATAHDALGGLHLVHTARPALVMLDVKMPGMNGFELLVSLRKDPQTRDTPVVLMSGLTESGTTPDEEWARATGASAYFTKPFDPERLAETARRLVERRPA